ncbi:DUF4339 domain-containing protein [Akkermansiaceae bacterium]|nr:DUF4339 domain-containing protein [Akkermansiaceae bacterium]
MSETQWFFTDSQQAQQGPYILSQIHELVGSGQITAETLLWYEGLETWSPASHFPDVAPYLPSPAPVAQAAPAQVAPAQVANPYQAPLSLNAVAPVGGEYPLPAVKPASFGKYIGLFIASILFVIIGMSMIAAGASSTADEFSDSTMNGWAEEMELSDFDEDLAAPDGNLPAPEEEITITDEQLKAGAKSMVVPIIGMGLIFLGCIASLFSAILSYIYLYRAWFILQPGGATTTPGKAVGFLFIPLFSLYWIFIAYVSWAKDWNRITSSYTNLAHAPKVSAGLFLAFPICIVGIVTMPIAMILGFVCLNQMCKAVNFIASARSQQQMSQPGAGMKLY